MATQAIGCTLDKHSAAGQQQFLEKFAAENQASLSLLNVLQQLIVNFALCGGMSGPYFTGCQA